MIGVLSAIFWGVMVLSVLVVVHEAGHFFAARACGMRVTEFYLGMPCPLRFFRKSKNYGTAFGVTPILLGGYTRICGMEHIGDEDLAGVLACVQRHGTVTSNVVAMEIGRDEEAVCNNLEVLLDWASIVCRDGGKDTADIYLTQRRDPHMLTEYDQGHNFELLGTTGEGIPRPVLDPEDFLAREKARTYAGKGFWKRMACLFAGPAVNVLLALVLVTGILMGTGYYVISDVNALGGVEEGGLAWEAGIRAGDSLIEVDGQDTPTWTDITTATQAALAKSEPFEISYERDGQTYTTTIALDQDSGATVIGIVASTELYHPGLLESLQTAVAYGGLVAKTAAELIMPQHTAEVISQSSSVVGISVMASEAASGGVVELLLFVAMISMSLGFMNLLPIPPLDGGKILIEIVQVVLRRQLSMRAQIIVSYVGLAFFLTIFFYALSNDITRIVAG